MFEVHTVCVVTVLTFFTCKLNESTIIIINNNLREMC